MADRDTVTTEVVLDLVVPGGPPLPVAADLRYDRLDPWAVRVVFRTGGRGDGTVVWTFARSLLTDGVGTVVGEGDVRVWPATRTAAGSSATGIAGAGSTADQERIVNLAMASPSGEALFELRRDDLVAFLQQTYLAVPTGAERQAVDLDAELAVLLGG